MDNKNKLCERCEERRDLLDIFEELSPASKTNLLIQARSVKATWDILKGKKYTAKKK